MTSGVSGRIPMIRRSLQRRNLLSLQAGLIGLALVSGLIVGSGRMSVLVALLLAGCLALGIFLRPEALLYGPIFIAFGVPASVAFGPSAASAFRLAVLAALAYLALDKILRGHMGPRFIWTDWALVAYITLIFGRGIVWNEGSSTKFVIDAIIPFTLYFLARRLPPAELRKAIWVMLAAATVGGLSVLFEYLVLHHPIAVAAEQYRWSDLVNSIYRPGGVYLSPPGASTVLGAALLASAPLWLGAPSRERNIARACASIVLVGNIVTFTRAPLVGLGVGVILLILLTTSTPRAAFRLGLLLTAAGSFLFIVVPTIESNLFFQQAFVRAGNYSVRENYWRDSLPVAFTSLQVTLFGHGAELISTVRHSGPTVSIPADIASVPLITGIGPHNQFVFTLIELGLAGLVSYVAWLGGSILLLVKRALSSPPNARLLQVGLAGALAVFLTGLWANEMHYPMTLLPMAIIAGMARAALESKTT